MVDHESFPCGDDDDDDDDDDDNYSRNQERENHQTSHPGTLLILPSAAKEGEFKEYLPKSFELPDMREAAVLRPTKTFAITGGMHSSEGVSMMRNLMTAMFACTKYGANDESNKWSDYRAAPPPSLPKEYHGMCGIDYKHGGSLLGALDAAQDGDKICIPLEHIASTVMISKSIAIIGMGETPGDTVIYRNRRSIDIDTECGL
jgi:hypothetical protein